MILATLLNTFNFYFLVLVFCLVYSYDHIETSSIYLLHNVCIAKCLSASVLFSL